MKIVCEKCKVIYSPNIRTGGRLPKGWRICPNCKETNRLKKEIKQYQSLVDKQYNQIEALSI